MLKQTLSIARTTRNAVQRTTISSRPILAATKPTTNRYQSTMSDSASFPAPFLPPSVKALASQPQPKIHLYTAGTPNGFKVSILLEELLLAYPALLEEGTIAYDIYSLKFSNSDQKTERFLKINPNGRIPAIVDDNAGGHNVFETSSILIWLVENYDKENKFWFSDPLLRSKALSWIFFGHGGVGPMQGQANHFYRYAPEKIPYGIKRYQDETRRLYSVLEDGLKAGKGEWLVGDQYSIADISIFGWVNSHKWAGLEDISEFPLLVQWIERIRARQGAQQGLDIPEPRKQNQSKEDEEKQAKEAAAWIFKDQQK